MIHFIRTEKGNTILEVEVWTEKYIDGKRKGENYYELSFSLDVKEYSLMLLSLPLDRARMFLIDVDALSEIRSWWWEKAINETDDANDFVRENLKQFAELWKLYYVED